MLLHSFSRYWFVEMGNIYLNRKYDVCSCLIRSENTQSQLLYVKTKFMRVYERAYREDWLSIPIVLFMSDES